MFKVIKVEIPFAEGPGDINLSFTSLKAANTKIRKLAREAPDNGTYNKTYCTVTWEDGFEYKIRIDLERKHADNPNIIGTEIRQEKGYLAGEFRPGWMSDTEYKSAMRRIAPKLAEKCKVFLNTYSTTD